MFILRYIKNAGKVVFTTVVLGGISAIGFGAVYLRLPLSLRRMVKAHPLIVELGTASAAVKLLSGLLTALTAISVLSYILPIGYSIVKLREKITQLLKIPEIREAFLKSFKKTNKTEEEILKARLFPRITGDNHGLP